jgi:hypothetical protein
MPSLVPEACFERALLLLDDTEWNKLLTKQAVKAAGRGPMRTGIPEIDALEAELFSKYGGA